MIYIYLAVCLAFGALYLDDRAQRSNVRDLTAQVAAAQGQIAGMVEQARQDAVIRDKALADLKAAQASRVNALRASYATAIAKIGAAYRETIAQTRRTVHEAISARADSACVVPVGAVLYHDRVASDPDAGEVGAQLPGAAGRSLDAPSGVALSDLAATVAGNYAAARAAWSQCAAEVTAWREWYPAQKALFSGE